MPDDLFSKLTEAQHQRLRDLGWTTTSVHGAERWVQPETGAWYTEAQALEWLAKHESQQGEKP